MTPGQVRSRSWLVIGTPDFTSAYADGDYFRGAGSGLVASYWGWLGLVKKNPALIAQNGVSVG
jgi:hypothetical protein